MRLVIALVSLAFSVSAQTIPGRFIVELDGEPLAPLEKPKTERSAESVRQHRSRIHAQHDALRSTLSSRGIAVRGEADTVANVLIVDNADAAQLRSLAGVRAVHPVRMLRIKLDRVQIVMKFPAAWEKAGGLGNAGAGMKIGIIDTGIDDEHAGFQDPTLSIPEGFPKLSSEANRRFTNNKVIVARGYNGSAEDRNGHGTGVAMAAAGVNHLGARGMMAGAAPKAWLGNYRVGIGSGNSISSDSVLLALDDAVNDGMDVVNLSFGGAAIEPPADFFLTSAIRRTVNAGVIVVGAAGNEGPEPSTIGDIASGDDIIAVGASESDREVSNPFLTLLPSTRFSAIPASNSEEAAAMEAGIEDITRFDPTSLGCEPLPAGSLSGRIALIQRGTCTFEMKFVHAESAGAVAVVVFNNIANPARSGMDVGAANLKGVMISRDDGRFLQDQLSLNPSATVRISFTFNLPLDPNTLTSFSSRGPSTDLGIKPDVIAVGGNIITATNGTPEGNPDASGYMIADGTSLSSPLVAGAAAVLKQVRRGLTAGQYRSLLINSALPFPAGVDRLQVQETGAGFLSFSDALSATTAVSPASLSFGEFRSRTPISKDLTITNLGQEGSALSLAIVTSDPVRPQLSATLISPGPGASEKVALTWDLTNPEPGPYQGFVQITSQNGTAARVPYWLGVRGKDPKQISILEASDSTPGTTTEILFRVVDAAGISLTDVPPAVTATAGGGSVRDVGLLGPEYPGVFLATVRLGPTGGVNVFQLVAGPVVRELRISSN